MKEVIHTLKSIFSRFGVQKEIINDNVLFSSVVVLNTSTLLKRRVSLLHHLLFLVISRPINLLRKVSLLQNHIS